MPLNNKEGHDMIQFKLILLIPMFFLVAILLLFPLVANSSCREVCADLDGDGYPETCEEICY